MSDDLFVTIEFVQWDICRAGQVTLGNPAKPFDQRHDVVITDAIENGLAFFAGSYEAHLAQLLQV